MANFASEPLGLALDLLGRDVDACELAQQCVTFLEAHTRSDDPDHAQHVRRQRATFDAERAVSRAEAAVAPVTVEVGAFENEIPERAGERLRAPPSVACLPSAGTSQPGSGMIGVICVQAAGDGETCDT